MNHFRYIFFLTFLVLLSCNDKDAPISVYEGVPAVVSVVNERLNDKPIVIIGSEIFEFLVAFESVAPDGSTLWFSATSSSLPVIVKDQFGNEWDLFGRCVFGTYKGQSLKAINTSKGFWFAWSSIFPNIKLDNVFGTGIIPVSEDMTWLVSPDFVNRGALLDAIPSLQYPVFNAFTEKSNLNNPKLSDDDEIIAVKIGKEIKIYPLNILSFHEIVNDTLDNKSIVISHHSYTETTAVFMLEKEEQFSTFGISGLIYNNNMLFYDRYTQSYWSQMLGICVNGHYLNTRLKRIPFVRIKWKYLKEMYVNFQLLNDDIGYGFDYSNYLLGDYRENNNYLPFPISNTDVRMKPKEMMYGIELDRQAIAFRLSDF